MIEGLAVFAKDSLLLWPLLLSTQEASQGQSFDLSQTDKKEVQLPSEKLVLYKQ